jgi:hypothetical protein
MGRILLGLLKGGVIGAVVGYLAGRAGIASGPIAFGVYAVVGAVAGLLCGRPLWRQDTLWTPLLKAIFGLAVGAGLFLVSRKFLNGVHIPIAAIPGASEHALPEVPALLGPAIGMVYGAFVELDDAGGASDTAKPKRAS